MVVNPLERDFCGQALGVFRRVVYFLANRMPVPVIHVHVGIDQARHYGGVGKVDDLSAFRFFYIRADLSDSVSFYKDLPVFLKLRFNSII